MIQRTLSNLKRLLSGQLDSNTTGLEMQQCPHAQPYAKATCQSMVSTVTPSLGWSHSKNVCTLCFVVATRRLVCMLAAFPLQF